MASQLISALIDALTELSRVRALTEAESLTLERAIKSERQKGGRAGGWSAEQDKTALWLRSQSAPVKEVAKRVGRSKDAVYARIRYLKLKQSGAPCVGRRG